MTDFLQTTESVITIAAVYLLVGLGWNLVYNASGYLNLAIGGFYILGAIFSYKIQTRLGIHEPILVGVLTVGAVGVLGYVSERLLLRPLKQMGLPPLIVTIGLSLILLQLAFELSPSLVIRPEEAIGGEVTPFGVHIPAQALLVWATAAIATAAVFLFFRRTDTGRAMRAGADNRTAAQTLGLRVASFGTIAFTASAMLAAIAGFVIAPTQGSAYNSGDLIAIKAFMAVSIVGLGRNGGAVFGALLVAGVQVYVARYVSQDLSDVIVLVAFVGVLYVYAARQDGGILPARWRLRRRGPRPVRAAGAGAVAEQT
jgi:branched-chain amino acid transport system permease protein